jgi:hypothetical protein
MTSSYRHIEEREVNLCFLLYQNTCRFLQRIQKLIFWSLQHVFTMILFDQVIWCIHESLFCRTSGACVQRALSHSLSQDQSEVWSHFITFNTTAIYFCTAAFVCLMNKCLAISLLSCLSHVFMTTLDGIMIWNEIISNKYLAYPSLH